MKKLDYEEMKKWRVEENLEGIGIKNETKLRIGHMSQWVKKVNGQVDKKSQLLNFYCNFPFFL